MARPSRDEVLMEEAFLWSLRSTCSRLNVGAVFAKDGRTLVTGYNGAPAGTPHCDHTCDCRRSEIEGQWDDTPRHFHGCRSEQPCLISEHAERNGIAYAARHGVRLEGSTLIVTHQPCLPCAMSVINAGVERVLFFEEYRDASGIEMLIQAGLVVDRLYSRI